MGKKKNKEIETTSDGSRAINKFRLSDFLIMAFLVILCLTCILPFIHLFVKSISSDTWVIAKRVYFWPKGATLNAYKAIFEDGSLVHGFLYTVKMTLIFTLFGMVTCTCAAYPLSKKRLKGRSFFVFVLMVPMYFVAGLIPSYLLFKDYGMLDTMLFLIWPLIYSPYNMLIMKTYFHSRITDSLDE